MKFQANKSYGNDLTVTILKRTEKTVTIETRGWGVQRVKIRDYGNGVEAISFKAWYITATEDFNAEKATEIANYNAYYR